VGSVRSVVKVAKMATPSSFKCYAGLLVCRRVFKSATLSSISKAYSTSGNANPFFNEEVQSLLKKLTRLDVNKVFRPKKGDEKLHTPEYKFMTTAQYNEAMREAYIKAEKKLQMPPVVPPRSEIDHVYVKDDELVGYSKSKFVFTDITFGKNDRSRSIVVRDADGVLRKANWEERERMNELYFPRPGREIKIPAMFTNQASLKGLLDKKAYEFVLDRACIQFEPDHPLFISVVESVYDKVNEEKDFNSLRSTRHYGPLVFFLVQKRNLDNLLIENLETDRLEDAQWALQLLKLMKPELPLKFKLTADSTLDDIQVYIQEVSKSKGQLEGSLKVYRDLVAHQNRERANL